MNTAIAIDDTLMAEADAVAGDLGLSRSGLIADALREYLLRLRRARLSVQLNQAYLKEPPIVERRLVRKFRTKVSAPAEWNPWQPHRHGRSVPPGL